MLVKVSKIEANPFRRLDHYKIIQEKVDELKNSINETTFWGGLLARENPNKKGFYQLAFGHHRIEAIRQLEIKEIDIQIRDIDDSLLLRMMANENLDTWKTTPAVINETVWAAKDFIDKIIKGKTYEEIRSNKSIRPLFDSEASFRSAKGKGVGQETLLKFLGDNWKQWMIQEALSTIQDENIDREAVEEFQTTKQASAFRRAAKTYEVPKHEQKALAKKIIKEGKDSVREVKEAVKNKATESKKSKALTIKDKKKIEEDLEVKELEELINQTNTSITTTTANIFDLVHKFEKLNIDNFNGPSVLKFNNKLFDLGNALVALSDYCNYTFSIEEKENE